MKKTLIALSLTSLFSFSALAANVNVSANEAKAAINDAIARATATNALEFDGDKIFIRHNPNDERSSVEQIGYVEYKDGKASYFVTDPSTGEKVRIDNITFDENDQVEIDNDTKITYTDGDKFTHIKVLDNNINPKPLPNFEEVSVSANEAKAAIEHAIQTNDLITQGDDIYAGDVKVGQINANGSATITDPTTGETYNVNVDSEGNVTNVHYTDEHGKNVNAKIVDNEMKPTPLPPRPENEIVPLPDADKAERDAWINAINNIYKDGDAMAQAGAAAYSNLDNKINKNTARIDSLEQDMQKMGNKMLDLEDRMDGVVATSHAITNARPMVQDAGEFAMGVGIGAAGSKQALALGGAYQFNANWSSSMTVNYETAGKRSNSQVSAGAGVQYRFK